MSDCNHERLLKGTHPSFTGGWLCEECGQLIKITADDLDEYVVVLAALKVGRGNYEYRRRGKADA